MPCYEVNLMSVEFNTKNKDLLIEALNKLKINYYTNEKNEIVTESYVNFDIIKGKAMLQENDKFALSQLNLIKRTVSSIALEIVSKSRKWNLKKKSDNKFQLIKY